MDMETPVKSGSRITTQLVAAFVANLGGFSYGCVWAWTSFAVPNLKEENSLGEVTLNSESWITAIVYLGAFVSGPLTGFLMDQFGRRMTFLLLNPALIIGWLLIAFAQDMIMLCAGRFITGLSCGGFITLAPIFISEMSQVEIRGILACAFDSTLAAGMLFMYIIGCYVSWSIQALVPVLIPICAMILLYFIPESPRYLVMHGKIEEGGKSLAWFRPGVENVDILKELNEIRDSVEEISSLKSKGNWKSLLRQDVVKPIAIGMALIFFHISTANFAILAYTVDIFRSAGIGNAAGLIDDKTSTVLVGLAQLVGAVLALFIVEKFRRRTLLFVSEITVAFTLCGLGVYFFLRTEYGGEFTDKYFIWLPLAMLFIFEVGFSIGIGCIPYLLVGECFPIDAKGISSVFINSTDTLLGFLMLHQFKNLMDLYGHAAGYWILTVISLGSIIFTYFCIPETKGKTLEEIQRGFTQKKTRNSTKL